MIEQGGALLRFDGVHAYYGKAKILDDVRLTVGEGETLALIGRNGAGKTTALASIFGIATVRQGTISVAGRPLALRRKYEAAKAGVSIAPQGRRILPNLTVEENLLLGMAAGRTGHWSLSSVYDLFPILRQRAGTRGTALSGGQLQMLAIGRALLANPRVLLLDEPSEGLAPVIIDELAGVLVEIRCAGHGDGRRRAARQPDPASCRPLHRARRRQGGGHRIDDRFRRRVDALADRRVAAPRSHPREKADANEEGAGATRSARDHRRMRGRTTTRPKQVLGGERAVGVVRGRPCNLEPTGN